MTGDVVIRNLGSGRRGGTQYAIFLGVAALRGTVVRVALCGATRVGGGLCSALAVRPDGTRREVRLCVPLA